MDGSIEALQVILHYGGHWVVPFAIAAIFWRAEWFRAGLVMIFANVIDADHLLANPVFDPERCSIEFHLLHSWEAALLYCVMLFVPRWWVRAFGAGALWHMLVDAGDCLGMAAF